MIIRSLMRFVALYALACLLCDPAFGDPPKPGIEKRVPWTTSRVTGSPEPPLPYVTERVFPKLKFKECLDVTSAPGSDRIFIAEQSGKIFSFPNRPDVETADLAIDLAKAVPGVQLYALVFHPDFVKNRYCYVCYIKANDLPDGSHIARFKVSDANPPVIDPASETTIFTWPSGGHNGCCLKFGLDGCLYISTGDGVGPNPPDTKRTGQDISDVLSSILRIDVDHPDEGRQYRIPPDNPFVGLKDARPEVWAYGLRNPWRMSVDRQTGDLWVGDVGWERWEMLDRIERGGNYGWAVTEGNESTNPEWPRGPTPILPPTIEHPHTESSSITDGLTYYGTRLKELSGVHIYSDYDTGKFWGFRWKDGKVIEHRELADTTHRVVGMGEAPDGECLILDHTAGTIHRLIPNPQPNNAATFPRKLSETGLFTAVREQTPAPGVIPYSINAEPWADFATMQRFVAIPGEKSAEDKGATFVFPADSVLVKTLTLPAGTNKSPTPVRIETQLLHFNGLEWLPYTYRWSDDQSDATLVGAAGADRMVTWHDPAGKAANREQTWHYSSRAECSRCHNNWSGPALAFNPPQLLKDHHYGAMAAPQLATFEHIKLVDKAVPTANQPRLVDPYESSADLTARARSWLQVNCAHCHRMHAGGAVLSHMHIDLPLEKTNMLGTRPTQGTFGIHAAQVIAPGDPGRSVLLYRISKLGGGRMPHIGSNEVDVRGVELIHDWITQLSPTLVKDTAGNESAAKLRQADTAELQRMSGDLSSGEQQEAIKKLLASTSGALLLLHGIDQHKLSPAATAMAIEQATQHGDVAVRDLFERFLPADKRVKRLGAVVQPEKILALSGDAGRGQKLFLDTAGVSCKNCHRIQQQGKEIGPDLTNIGKTQTRAQLLESILEPSKRIDPKYVTYLVETTEGRLITGLLIKKTDSEIVVKDAQDQLVTVPKSQVEQLVPQQQSLMPDLQLKDLTAEQVADLLAYLSSLK